MHLLEEVNSRRREAAQRGLFQSDASHFDFGMVHRPPSDQRNSPRATPPAVSQTIEVQAGFVPPPAPILQSRQPPTHPFMNSQPTTTPIRRRVHSPHAPIHSSPLTPTRPLFEESAAARPMTPMTRTSVVLDPSSPSPRRGFDSSLGFGI